MLRGHTVRRHKFNSDNDYAYGHVFSTGQVAKLLRVASRTVSMWCDTGRLKHWTIPHGAGKNTGNDKDTSGRDRRISALDLLEFLKKNGMPIPSCLTGRSAVLLGFPEHEVNRLTDFLGEIEWGVYASDSWVEGCYSLLQHRHRVFAVHYSMQRTEAAKLGALIRGDFQATKFVWVNGPDNTDDDIRQLTEVGWVCVPEPLGARDILNQTLGNGS